MRLVSITGMCVYIYMCASLSVEHTNVVGWRGCRGGGGRGRG